MITITDKIKLGSVAEFGDAKLLEDAGIELAVLCQARQNFPHSAEVGAVALYLHDQMPSWFIRGCARLISDVYGIKTIILCDNASPPCNAAFLLCCAGAENQGVSFDTALAWLVEHAPETKHVNIADELIAIGRAVWP